jgi:hypothetical protein
MSKRDIYFYKKHNANPCAGCRMVKKCIAWGVFASEPTAHKESGKEEMQGSSVLVLLSL